MSLLEVVFAVVLLALIASAVTSAISLVGGSEIRAQKRLGAYELANRLILQHLTNPREMPSSALPLDYDRFRYRYELTQERLSLHDAHGEPALPEANRRFKQVQVTVWEVDDDLPGTPRGDQLAVLTRLIDPFAARNPEAVENLQAEDVIKEIEILLEAGVLPQGGGQ